MNEVTPEEAAGGSPVSIPRNSTAKNVLPPELKTISPWKVIGRVEMAKQALKISIDTPYDGRQVYYIGSQALQPLRSASRTPCDIMKIREGIDETEVIESAGRAYPSRSGKALCMKITSLAGAEAMVPWAYLIRVVTGLQTAARVSTLMEVPNRQQKATSALTHGLSTGF